MPVLTAAACTPTVACPISAFPSRSASCACDPTKGGVNDLYFIPCSEILSETNLNDVAWWSSIVAAGSGGSLGSLGKGLGSIAKKADKKERLSSCKVEQVVSTTWALKYVLKCFDKSADKVTHQQIDALINSASDFQVIARMCDGDNTVLPIGPFALSDFNWTVPDNFEELQSVELEISWVELGMPKTYTVAGLSAVVPKS